jgi:hypothetical protein
LLLLRPLGVESDQLVSYLLLLSYPLLGSSSSGSYFLVLFPLAKHREGLLEVLVEEVVQSFSAYRGNAGPSRRALSNSFIDFHHAIHRRFDLYIQDQLIDNV